MNLDWATLAFQTVNVAVLVWLLSRVFWRPMAAMVAARRAEVAARLDEAETRRADAEASAAALAAERQGIADEREAALARARDEAEALRGKLLSEARAEAEALRGEARRRAEADRHATEAAFAARAADLAAEMAGRIGARLDGPAYRAACLDAVASEIASLPAAERAALARRDDLALVTAAELPEAERQDCAARLGEVLGAPADLAFRSDPGLVAGLELAAPHLTLGQSWRGAIGAMRQEIDRDE